MIMTRIWNVFLPNKILNQPSGFLTGIIDDTRGTIFIKGTYCDDHAKEENIVGKWMDSSAIDLEPQPGSHSVNLIVRRTSRGTLCCTVQVVKEHTYFNKCICVLFEPKDMILSLILSEQVFRETENLNHLIRIYAQQNYFDREKSTFTQKFVRLQKIFVWFLYIWIHILKAVEQCVCIMSLKWFRVWTSMQPPVIVSHINARLNRFQKVLSTQQRPNILFFDICTQQLMDSVLGLTVMMLFLHDEVADSVAAFIMQWADGAAAELKTLLNWLMGAPAGLKLNSQLTEYMGHFFLYHVYLWTGYMSLLKPVLAWVLWCAAGLGLLGLTTQLCIVQDILSLLTIHIYCFYVYAARIYSLQVFGLSSLWRLFRGKKWNVLRLRVDTALYNIDQLFVGTLIFTVLLFLLPTSLLYYFVFTSLRLLILLLHWVLSSCVEQLNNIPAFTLLTRCFHSRSVAGNVMFTVLHQGDDDNCLTLSMLVTQLPLIELYLKAQTEMKASSYQKVYSWSELLRRLTTGSLIYPWVHSSEESAKEKDP